MNSKHIIAILVIALVGAIVLPLVGMCRSDIRNIAGTALYAVTAIIAIDLLRQIKK